MKRLILPAVPFRDVSAMATSRLKNAKSWRCDWANHTSGPGDGHFAADCSGTGAGRNGGFGANKASSSSGRGTRPVLVPAEMSGRRICHAR
jgi:hypothetical protein